MTLCHILFCKRGRKMPTDTFLKLSEEKKSKIIKAAKKEFARVPIEQASIKNIVQEAEIARGSFYQYFTSKEDLLSYIMKRHMDKMNQHLQKNLKETNGDIVEVFIRMYDYMLNQSASKENQEFYHKIFENLKTSEETMFFIKPEDPFSKLNLYEKIDQTKLKIKDEADLETIVEMLNTITRKSIVDYKKYKTKEEAREEFIKRMRYLKSGIEK